MTGAPLSDVVVADFTHARARPWCTELLGELGAEVVKIEHPGGGDPNRDGHPQQGGMGFEFISRHKNKKSVVIDLKDEDGRQLAEDFVAEADVLVENFGRA